MRLWSIRQAGSNRTAGAAADAPGASAQLPPRQAAKATGRFMTAPAPRPR
jgi:hypothetical protein